MKKHAIIFTSEGAYSNLGRMTGANRIANVCEQQGWDIDVIQYIPYWSDEEIEVLADSLITSHTKWIGLTYTFFTKDSHIVKKLFYYLQTKYDNLIYILGGMNEFEEPIPADYFINGYAEEVILKVLDYEFGNGSTPKFIPKHGGKYINALQLYPTKQEQSYRVNYKNSDFLTPDDVLTIEMSRGCRFKCAYCTHPILGVKEDNSVDEELLYRELNENYQQWGITKYVIADETLNDRTSKLIKLRNVSNRLSFKPQFVSYIRADLFKAHPEHIELLAESNVIGQLYGVETFNHKAGKSVGKGMDPLVLKDLLLKSNEYFNKHMDFFRGSLSLIVGLPYETQQTFMEDTIDWCYKHWSKNSIHVWTLMLSVTGSSVSAMGANLSKYGYEVLPGTDINASFGSKPLRWKSPWMDSDTAAFIQKEVKRTNVCRPRPALCILGYLSSLGSIESFLQNERDAAVLRTGIANHISRYKKNLLEYAWNKKYS